MRFNNPKVVVRGAIILGFLFCLADYCQAQNVPGYSPRYKRARNKKTTTKTTAKKSTRSNQTFAPKSNSRTKRNYHPSRSNLTVAGQARARALANVKKDQSKSNSKTNKSKTNRSTRSRNSSRNRPNQHNPFHTGPAHYYRRPQYIYPPIIRQWTPSGFRTYHPPY